MPFLFTLPTTSHISFTFFFSSTTHPSLPLTATSARSLLRTALKTHKRLPEPAQASNLPTIISALTSYIPYLFALEAGLSGIPVAGEEIDIVLLRELDVTWRMPLSAPPPGRRSPPRTKLRSLEAELAMVLTTLAHAHTLSARAALRPLLSTSATDTVSPEGRTQAVASAMNALMTAHSLYTFVLSRITTTPPPPPTPADLTPEMLSSLASGALAEATLLTVLRDDPYPALVAEERREASNDWMFRAPTVPRVRAHLFARLCLAAGEHAARASAAAAGVPGAEGRWGAYCADLRRTARARAARFLGVDAEAEGKGGEGIAWIRGAKAELGLPAEEGLGRLRLGWRERREDKRVERGGEWGGDAGKLEEGRVLELLERKWVKMNDTIGMQIIPPHAPLLATMPSGREYHTPRAYVPPHLDAGAVARMRAPPDANEVRGFQGGGDESDSEGEGYESAQGVSAPGAYY
ncbi:hypothetical protein EJ06DRAFT_494057 [Trichodelitschia bisporula]|uniref:pH-response regulator protein palC n=1 Tax=Trichodelitschia bisporula TaxID=703511 RepID=A0A6G1HWR0_9PEZI|nr:hypothetical protein EJ06DRAFT_494057 [Trichodelitschia bisporula]